MPDKPDNGKVPEYTVRKGDMAVLRITHTSFALSPEDQQPPHYKFWLVKIESATRQGLAKKYTLPSGATSNARDLFIMVLKNDSADWSRHPNLLEAWQQADGTGLFLGTNVIEARAKVQALIKGETENES